MEEPRRKEPSRLKRILNLRMLEDPKFRKGMFYTLAIVVVSYLVYTEFFGDPVGPVMAIKYASAIMLFFLGVLIEHVIQLRMGSRVEIFEDDFKAEDRQKGIIDKAKPQEVKMCEYSAKSSTAATLLRTLVSSKSTRSIKLLIKHPEEVCPSSQKDCRQNFQLNQIIGKLESLSNDTYHDAQTSNSVALRIKCYRGPASLRGRNFGGKYVVLGWYTYDRKAKRRHSDQLWGAENAVIVAPCNDEDGIKLKEWFDKVFDDLWTQAEPLNDAVAGYTHHIDSTWLEAVSQSDEREQPSEN